LEQRNWMPTLPSEKALIAILHKDWDQIASLGEDAIAALAGALGFYTVGTESARALLNLGTPGCDALVHALNQGDANSTIRETASIALAEIGDSRAIKPLQSMLRDPDLGVRQFAVWTLERLGWEPTTKPEEAIAALAHGDWDHLRILGASAVEPLLQMAVDSMEREEAVSTIDHILDIVPGRISIRQFQELVSLDEMTVEYSTAPWSAVGKPTRAFDDLGKERPKEPYERTLEEILQ